MTSNDKLLQVPARNDRQQVWGLWCRSNRLTCFIAIDSGQSPTDLPVLALLAINELPERQVCGLTACQGAAVRVFDFSFRPSIFHSNYNNLFNVDFHGVSMHACMHACLHVSCSSGCSNCIFTRGGMARYSGQDARNGANSMRAC